MHATPQAAPPRVKPRLRGLSHEITFYFAIAATIALGLAAAPGLPTLAAVIYGLSNVALFGMSALYHRPMWTPEVRARLRRADHAAIFVLIAGSYAPIGLLALPAESGHRLLAIVWGGCLAGLLKALFWAHAPRWITALIYVVVGWAAALEYSALGEMLGPVRTWFIFGGGICYSVGALVYARKRPDPVPEVFGYHEIFHALVVAAAFLHFSALGSVVLLSPPT
jgi:hemolysin III